MISYLIKGAKRALINRATIVPLRQLNKGRGPGLSLWHFSDEQILPRGKRATVYLQIFAG